MSETARKLEPRTGPEDFATASPIRQLGVLSSTLQALVDDKRGLIEVSVAALLSGGHILLEDVPGVGKTTYIKAFARLLGLDLSRIQFTSDLLPSDITGVEVWNPATNAFDFHKGPLFTQILLADELNRASPRTQSALLEAMGEGCVTIERRTIRLPEPFIVFASQNPSDNLGTFDLPESQLDRFSARIRIGYPSSRRELEIFRHSHKDPLAKLPSTLLTAADLLALQSRVDDIHVSERIAGYVKRLIDATRADSRLRLGVSTRGGVMWLRMARGLALLHGRDHVIPDDLRDLAVPCLSHRVIAASAGAAEEIIMDLAKKIDPV